MKQAGFLTMCGLAMCALARAQDSPAKPPSGPAEATPAINAVTPEMTQREAPVTFSTRVNLVMVPVIVRDRKGNAAGNLYKEDFQLFDKGKPQTIVRFNVEKMADRAAHASAQARAAAEEAQERIDLIPSRFLAYLFDDVHLAAADLTQSRTAAKKHLAGVMKATDRAAIYSTSGKVRLDFTGDRAALEEALDRLEPQPPALFTGANDCPPMNAYMADQILHNDNLAYQAAIRDAVQCANLNFNGLDATATAQAVVQGAATRATARAEQDNQRSFAALTELIGRMTTSPGERMIVLVSPGFYVTTEYRALETNAIDKAIRSNIVISTLDARGVYTYIAGGDATRGGMQFNAATQAVKERMERESQMASGEILGEFAEGTGGTWFHNDNGLKEGLDKIVTVPEYEYGIGFSPQNLRFDGKFHELKVVVKGKEYSVQARRGYYAPMRETTEAEQAQEEIREAFFSREEAADVPIAFQTQFFKLDPKTARVSVLARIDLKQMNFRKQEGRNLNTVTVVTGIFDTNGNLVKGIVKTVDLKLKDDNLQAKLAAGLAAKTSFDLAPGKYVLRLVVRDGEDQMMSARNGVVSIP